MVINTNLAAESSSHNLSTSQARLAQSLARISSGSKIVQPADDAAGLAVSTKLDAQIHRIQGARANVANATSFVQTQDGYLKKIAKALDRMSELSILAQDATKSDNDRSLYNKEFSELQEYIATAATKDFNGVSLFSSNELSVTVDSDGGSFAMAGIDMSVSPYAVVSSPAARANMKLSELGITDGTISWGTPTTTAVVSANDTLQQVFDRIHELDSDLTASLNEATGLVTLTNSSSASHALSQSSTNFFDKLNLGSSITLNANDYATSSSDLTPTGIGIGTVAAAKDSLTKVKAAIDQLASDRASIGSYQSRLAYSGEQLTISKENLMAASSRIKDVDVAEESTEYARANIMVQSGTAMLAQANQLPQQVLRLLQ